MALELYWEDCSLHKRKLAGCTLKTEISYSQEALSLLRQFVAWECSSYYHLKRATHTSLKEESIPRLFFSSSLKLVVWVLLSHTWIKIAFKIWQPLNFIISITLLLLFPLVLDFHSTACILTQSCPTSKIAKRD